MTKKEYSTPPCIMCSNCKPVSSEWVCNSILNKKPEIVDYPFNKCGECKAFLYRTTVLKDAISEDEWTYNE